MGEPPLVAPIRPFKAELAGANPPPPILQRLAHERSSEGPHGLVSGIANIQRTAGAAVPPPARRGAVQRLRGWLQQRSESVARLPDSDAHDFAGAPQDDSAEVPTGLDVAPAAAEADHAPAARPAVQRAVAGSAGRASRSGTAAGGTPSAAALAGEPPSGATSRSVSSSGRVTASRESTIGAPAAGAAASAAGAAADNAPADGTAASSAARTVASEPPMRPAAPALDLVKPSFARPRFARVDPAQTNLSRSKAPTSATTQRDAVAAKSPQPSTKPAEPGAHERAAELGQVPSNFSVQRVVAPVRRVRLGAPLTLERHTDEDASGPIAQRSAEERHAHSHDHEPEPSPPVQRSSEMATATPAEQATRPATLPVVARYTADASQPISVARRPQSSYEAAGAQAPLIQRSRVVRMPSAPATATSMAKPNEPGGPAVQRAESPSTRAATSTAAEARSTPAAPRTVDAPDLALQRLSADVAGAAGAVPPLVLADAPLIGQRSVNRVNAGLQPSIGQPGPSSESAPAPLDVFAGPGSDSQPESAADGGRESAGPSVVQPRAADFTSVARATPVTVSRVASSAGADLAMAISQASSPRPAIVRPSAQRSTGTHAADHVAADLQRAMDQPLVLRSAPTVERIEAGDGSIPAQTYSVGAPVQRLVESARVQRETETPAGAGGAGAAAPADAPAGGTVTAPAAAAAPSAHMGDREMEDLLNKLYPKLRLQLSRELLVARERSGLLTDVH